MKVLTIAASAGKHSSSQTTNSSEKQFSVVPQAPLMHSIVEEEEEPVDDEEQSPLCPLKSEVKPDSSHLPENSSGLNKVKGTNSINQIKLIFDITMISNDHLN